MKTKFKILICLVIQTIITSCTKVIQVKVPTGAQLVVVSAFLDNSANQQIVRLTFNADYFSNVSTPPVLGATVTLNDLTNTKTYTFTPDGNGNYIYMPDSINAMGVVHHKYQLNISYNGNTYNAQSTLNRTVEVDTITFRVLATDAQGTHPLSDTTNPRKYYPFVTARDSSGTVADYYWLKVYHNGIYYDQPAQIDAFQDAGGEGTDGLLFGAGVAFRGLTNNNNPIYRNDICTVEIYSINKDTESFLAQLKAQMTNAQSGLFAVTPQNVKTNIQQTSGTQQAVGWFNMGAIASKSIVAR